MRPPRPSWPVEGTVDKLTAWFFAHQEVVATVGGLRQRSAGSATSVTMRIGDPGVKAEAPEGGPLGVGSTPTFFINGRRLKGGLPPQYFEAAIEIELRRAK